MKEPLLLYSVNTWLAWLISNRFYGDVHWIWCSPFFRSGADLPAALPPSAIPASLYERMHEDVRNGDQHSDLIARNRIGILKGAEDKHEAGVITMTEKNEIVAMVSGATIDAFRPLLYVIPYKDAKDGLVAVPPGRRAHCLSIEYILPSIPGSAFAILELRKSI
jgi:hypothetical protein